LAPFSLPDYGRAVDAVDVGIRFTL